MNRLAQFFSLALLLVSSFSNSVFSQNLRLADSLFQRVLVEKNDSVRSVLYGKIGYQFFNSKIDSAEVLIEKACSAAKKSACTTCLIDCYRYKGFIKDRRQQFAESLFFYDTAQILCEKSKRWCDLSIIFSQKGGVLNRKRDFEAALVWQRKSVEILEANDCPERAFVVYYNFFTTLTNMGRHAETLEPLRKAVEAAEKSGNLTYRMASLSSMSSELLKASKPEESKIYAKKSLELSRAVGDKMNETQALYWLAVAAGHQGLLDSQYIFIKHALKTFGDSQDKFLKLQIYALASVSFAYVGQIDEALDALAIAYPMAQKQGGLANLSSCLLAYGKIYQHQNDLAKAEQSFLESANLLDEHPEQLALRSQSYRHLFEFYESAGFWEKALKTQRKYQQLIDSLNNNEQQIQLAVLETELKFHKDRAAADRDIFNLKSQKLEADFQLSKKDRELLARRLESEQQQADVLTLQAKQMLQNLEIISKENQLRGEQTEREKQAAELQLLSKNTELQNAQIRSQQLLFALLAALAAAAGWLLFRFFKKRRRADALALRTDLARDLHDDLGSEISSLGMSAFTAARSGDPARMSEVLQEVSSQSSRLVEDMRDLVWSLHPENDTLDKMLARVRQTAERLFDEQEVAVRSEIEPSVGGLRLAPEVHRQLFLMFKESLHNAARHARCRSVWVRVRREGGSVVFEVADDGAGFDFSEKKEAGNGLRNLRNRAAALGGLAEIFSEIGRGTSISWRLPVNLEHR